MIWQQIVHIAGVVGAYAAAVALIVGGFITDAGPNGQLITLGITAGAASTIAVIDGATAKPDVKIFGSKKVGAKFSGLSQLGFILILATLVIGIGVSFIFA